MDETRFDLLVRSIGTGPSRRALLRLVAATLSLTVAGVPITSVAKGKNK